MSPKSLPNPPRQAERVALIGVQTPADFESDSEGKPKRPYRFDDQVNPRWLRVPAATKYSSINRSRLFRLIAEGKIRSACVKEHPRAKRGVRLVDRFALDLYLETLARPIEERLAQEANELLLAEQELAKQQELLTRKQHAVQAQLTEIRGHRSPDAT